jgi:hypothetical protein
VEIDFASLYKIPRSEKPIVAFKVSTSAGAFSYIESAAFEGNKDYDEYICSDLVLVGSHGPNRKFKTDAQILSSARYVIFTEGNDGYFRNEDTVSNVYYLSYGDSALKILFTD